MDVFSRLERWLTGRAPEGPPVWRALDERGASRELCRFAEEHGRDVPSLWASCARPSWAIEIAARAGVDGRLVVAAVDELAGALDGDALGADAARTRTDALAAARAWADGRLDAEELVFAVAALESLVVESRPEVKEALGAVPTVGNMQDIIVHKDAYDAVYRDAQRALTELVRRRIGVRDVQVALEGLTAHPYR